VEFFIQKMNDGRKMIRDNQYVTLCHGEDGGTLSTIGYNRDDQLKYAKLLNQKWGYPAMVWEKTKFRFYHKVKGA
jgi:hypothetical protein